MSGVAPIPLEAAEAEAVAEMGLMKGEDLVERLSGVSPLLLIPAEAAAAVCSAAAAAATEPEADDETVVLPFEDTAAAAAAAAAARPVRLLVLLLAFGVDDLGMGDKLNKTTVASLLAKSRELAGAKLTPEELEQAERSWNKPELTIEPIFRNLKPDTW